MSVPITFGDFTGYDIKTAISEKLNLGTSSVDKDRIHENFWKIIRGGIKIPQNLVMLHYKEESLFIIADKDQTLFTPDQQNNLLKLRGLVYDINSMQVVCSSLGYSPVISATTVPDGLVTDCYGGVHDLSDSNVLTFHTGHDIFQIRTFLYDYVVYYISNTNFDITNSKFYSEGPTFKELFLDLGGPDEDELYGKMLNEYNGLPLNQKSTYSIRSRYSNVNHIFLIVSPWTQTASQSLSGNGYIQYFGLISARILSMQEHQDINIAKNSAWNGVLFKIQVANSRMVPMVNPTSVGDKRIILTESINRFQANNFLQNGYYSPVTPDVNKWMWKGEFIIALTSDERGFPKKWIRIAHPSRLLREAILGGNSNLLNRAFQLRDLCNKQEPYTGDETINFNGLELSYNYGQLFPFIATPDIEDFKEMYRDMPQIIAGIARIYMRHGIDELNDWRLTPTKDFRDYRFSNAMFLMIISAPPNRKADVATYYEQYFIIKDNVYNYIASNIAVLLKMFFNDNGVIIQPNNVQMFKVFPWSKNDEIFTPAKRLHNIVTNAYNASKGSGKDTISITLKNVELYLKGEKGSTLYQLYTTIKRSQNLTT